MARPDAAAVGVLLHVYYVDLLPSLIDCLRHFPDGTSILASTAPEHVDTVAGALADAMPRAHVDCRSVPNTGRDIAPMLVEFGEALLRLDVVCKLHTKKSPHHVNDNAWREYLLHNLAGAGSIVDDALASFERQPGLGALFPAAEPRLKAWMGWDEAALQAVRPLCDTIGVDPRSVPDFPAGSMYWFRPRALDRLLSRPWVWRDFEADADGALLDGTLAHGIERIILAVVQDSGHTWWKTNPAGGPRRVADRFQGHSGPGVAVVLHVWSLDGIMAVIAGLKNLAFDFDLLVSVSGDVEAALHGLLTQHFPASRCRIYPVPNAGHDIGPFIALGPELRRYALACKLHVKRRSPEWLAYLLDNLVGGIAEVNTIVALFERDPRLGIVYPRAFPPAREHLEWGGNYDNARALAARLGVPAPDPGPVSFASGSMFWFRPVCLGHLLDPGLGLSFDECDNDRPDGTLSHAVERMFLHLARHAGYGVREVLFHPYRGDPDLRLYPRRDAESNRPRHPALKSK